MPLKLAFSSCPNDTLMFHGIVTGAVPIPWPFETRIGDIEELNHWAFQGLSDITKLSFHAYFQLADRYLLLRSGAALGRGCGPLVISRHPLDPDDLPQSRIAVPGMHTTATLLFRSFAPEARRLIPMLFCDIETAICNGEVDAGVIIHETRFTYTQRGLQAVVDLGDWWERETGHPIPLGCIAVRRNLADVGAIFQQALRTSVSRGLADRTSAYPFIRRHAQELDPAVIDAHINLYVNDYSLDIGPDGEAAIRHLYRFAHDAGVVPTIRQDIFC